MSSLTLLHVKLAFPEIPFGRFRGGPFEVDKHFIMNGVNERRFVEGMSDQLLTFDPFFNYQLRSHG